MHNSKLWLLLLVVFCPACNNDDRDRLARVGKKIVEKLDGIMGGADGNLGSGWQALRSDLNQMALDARISARLRWDKTLEGAAIQVHATNGVVDLQGKVRDLAQRRRAVDLAESTLGADKVNDSLEVPATE